MMNKSNKMNKMNSINKTIYIMIIGVVTQLIFWSYVAPVVGATTIQHIRGLNEITDVKKTEAIPCNPGTNGTNCVCPDVIRSDFIGCLKYNGEFNGCHPINCWKWNDKKNQCEESGKEYIPALVLQCIPFTGFFGSGFGNMGRWDIFGTYMAVVFGGCLFICCCGMACSFASKNQEDHESFVQLGTKCGSCLWSVAMLTIWIWGIVVIANKEVNAPWYDWEGKPIMCPLV